MKKFLFLCLMLVSIPSFAAENKDREVLKEVEDYLNSITTMKARFAQHSSNGDVAEGILYLSKPGKMRLEYDKPVPVLMVADGDYFIYYDKDLEQTTYLGVDDTPAAILLKKNFSFANEKEVDLLGVKEDGKNIAITVVQKKDPLAGKLTLIVRRNPLELVSWEVVDAQKIKTIIILSKMERGTKLDDSLFIFKDPKREKSGFGGRNTRR